MKNTNKTVGIHEAKTNLSKLLKNVEKGQEVILSRSGVPVAKIIPFMLPQANRIFGKDEGKIWIAEDFDEPIDPETFS
jgi:prevent-host-death family protein